MVILTAVLPVIGTWVGTVLAFYFARENFEAAARASERLLSGKSDRPAMDFAIKPQNIDALDVTGKADAAVTLAEIRAKLAAIGKYRVPLMTDGKAKVKYVIHRQPLETYLVDNPTLTNATLEQLLASPAGQGIKDGVAFVKEKATVGEAKAAMEARPYCQDVFITNTGLSDGTVVGWLTNNEIQHGANTIGPQHYRVAGPHAVAKPGRKRDHR